MDGNKLNEILQNRLAHFFFKHYISIILDQVRKCHIYIVYNKYIKMYFVM